MPGMADGIIVVLLTADWLRADESDEWGNQKSFSCTRGAAQGLFCFIGPADRIKSNFTQKSSKNMRQ